MTTFVYDNCTAHWHRCINVIQCRCGWSTVWWSSVSMCVVCCLWYSADVDDLLSGGERWHSGSSSQWSEASLCRDRRSQFVRRWSNDVRRLKCFWYSAELVVNETYDAGTRREVRVSRPRRDRDTGVTVLRRDWDVQKTHRDRFKTETTTLLTTKTDWRTSSSRCASEPIKLTEELVVVAVQVNLSNWLAPPH